MASNPDRWPAPTREEWARGVASELGVEDADRELSRTTPAGLTARVLEAPRAGAPALPEGLRPVRGWRACRTLAAGDADAHAAARRAAQEGVGVLRLSARSPRPAVELADTLAGELDADVRLVLEVDDPRALAEAAPGRPAACDPVRALLCGRASAADLAAAGAGEAALVGAGRGAAADVRLVEVDAAPVREAGGTAVDGLAFALAALAERVRHAVAHGVGPDEYLARLAVRFGVGRDLLEEVAALRALRLLVAKLAPQLGARVAGPLHLRAVGLGRELAPVDRLTNALRTSAHAFAAAVGGAQEVELPPFEPGSRRGERLAHTTHAVLAHEAHLGRVDDPAGGAYAVEALTDALARAAWDGFRRVEAAGGLERWVASGALAAQVSTRREELARAVREGRHVLVGVTKYPGPDDGPPVGRSEVPADEPVAAGWPRLAPLREADLHEGGGTER